MSFRTKQDGVFMTSHTSTNKSSWLKPPDSYQIGSVLDGHVAAAKKTLHGRQLIRNRVAEKGRTSIYDLTGLVRSFPLDPEDLPMISSQIDFEVFFGGQAEELAIKTMGGDLSHHGAVICNRVTSGMLGVMLALVNSGDKVLSLIPDGRSHPSVQQAVELAGGEFFEASKLSDLDAAFNEGAWRALVITPVTPQKYHLEAADVKKAVFMAKSRGIMVVLDDAHMYSRMTFYQEPPSFDLGDVDVSVWSLDKHVPGPRGAAVVAKREVIDEIYAKVFLFGLEAQTGHYVAGLRGMEALQPGPVQQAGSLARELLVRLKKSYGNVVYQAGPGVAISDQDFGSLVKKKAGGKEIKLVSSELSVAASFVLLQKFGIVTIPVTSGPGAAPAFRLMMHPDGGRLGLDVIEEAVDIAVNDVAMLVDKPEDAKVLMLGNS